MSAIVDLSQACAGSLSATVARRIRSGICHINGETVPATVVLAAVREIEAGAAGVPLVFFKGRYGTFA
jgi:hypothetical protein